MGDRFGLGRATFRFSPDDDPTKGYIPTGNPIDPTGVTPDVLPSTPKTSVKSMTDIIRELQANRPQRTEMERLINEEPDAANYQPNKMTRLGAILGGVSAGFRDPAKGVDLANSIISRRYNEARDTHANRLRNVSALAGLEGQDIEGLVKGATADEQIRQHEQTFGRGVLESDRAYNRGVTTSDRDYGLEKDKFKMSGWKGVENTLKGTSGFKNLISGEDISLGQTSQTPAQEMADKIKLFGQTQGAEGKADRENRLAISKEGTARATSVANIRANNARILAERSIGADEAVKQMNTELGNQLTNPNSPLFDLDLDEYTEIGPTGTRKFKSGVAEKKENAAIVGALAPYLQIDAGKSRAAQPNSTAKEILDAYEREHPKSATTPAGRGGGAGR